jgi:protein involved in polysaccharide export with SLBB domain
MKYLGVQKMTIYIKLLGILLLLSACSSSFQTRVDADFVKAHPSRLQTSEYVIQTGDQLEIKFFYNPELNELLTVRPDGRITLQLAHEVVAAGLTPAGLTESLTKTYSKELANPGIAVIVRSFSSQKVYVDGEVNKPGVLTLSSSMTVLQSIAEAGGFKNTAKQGDVLIIRKSGEKSPLTIVVNLKDAIYGSDTSQDIALAPYDIVYVPKSVIANINQFVDQYIRQNIPMNVGLSYGFGF